MGEEAARKAIETGTIVHRHDPGASSRKNYTTWYRGRHTRRAPNQEKMMHPDAVADHVVQGWAPARPVIDKTTRITAFGSCFAANISSWLGQRNYRVSTGEADAQKAYVVQIGEGMVNSFVIRQQFEWAWEGKTFDQPLWHGYEAEAFGYDPEVQAQTRALFDKSDVFILTFGLSEVWYDAPSGEVFWRTIPKMAYDATRHRFRVTSVEENRANIEAVYRLVRKHRPSAKIIMTLSPVPLIATFRETSCITSNAVSKSVLRVAIDECLRALKDEGHLFYWPSYEIVTDVFGNPFKADRRHLPRSVLEFIMNQFERSWCKMQEGDTLPPLDEAYVKALAASRILPQRLERSVANGRADVLERHVARAKLHPDARVNAAMCTLLSNVLAGWRTKN